MRQGGAVMSDAPITFVSNVRRHQSASASARATIEISAGGVDDVVEGAQLPRRFSHRVAALLGIGDVAGESDRSASGLLRCLLAEPTPAGGKGDVAPPAHRWCPMTRPIPAEAPTTSTRRPSTFEPTYRRHADPDPLIVTWQ